MKKVIVLYGPPADPAAFDRHYEETHVKLVTAMPRLKEFSYSKGTVQSSEGDDKHYLIAEMVYDNQEDLDHALQSPEGVAAVEDVGNFATGGVEIITIDVQRTL